MIASLRLYPFIAIVALVVLASAVAWSRSRRKTPEQRERERRMRISETGRITDGTVTDVSEVSLNESGEMQLLIYQYDVSGVTYEASQDVTTLRHMVDLHSCRSGLMTSIKYDPSNPGNSIVISENWTGLRH
jgi:Flp pilus assembly protein TadB